MVSLATVLALVIACWYYVGLFDAERLGEGIPSLASLVGEMFPPNFSQAGSWVKPLLDTLAMSVAGTAVAVLLSLPLAVLEQVVVPVGRPLWIERFGIAKSVEHGHDLNHVKLNSQAR